MVNLVEDWDALEEYAGEKLEFYQLLGSGGTFEIHVQTGRLSFKGGFVVTTTNHREKQLIANSQYRRQIQQTG